MSKNEEQTNEQEGSTQMEWPIRVTLGEVNEETGAFTLNVAYGEEFRDWFMKREGLKRWSEKRFQKVVGPILEEYYEKQSQQVPVDSKIEWKDPEVKDEG